MKNFMTFIIVILMNVPLWAMSSLSDLDLSDVSSPQSLGITSEKKVNDSEGVEDKRNGILKKFYKNTKTKSGYLLVSLDETLDVNETIDNDEAENNYNISNSLDKNHEKDQRSLLIDQINGKYTKDMIASEENPETNISAGKDDSSHTLAYPEGVRSNNKGAYQYRLIFNNTEMRDTFIHQRNTDIRSGSWVDIKVR